MGYFPQKPGWEGYVPLGGPLAILEPCWVAAQGRTLGVTTQEFLWPQLVPQEFLGGTALGKARNPQAVYTSLEGFAKGFLEAAAICGPGIFPCRDSSLVPYSPSQWHQERSLTTIARRGLMRHPVVHAALEAAPSHASLHDLLAHVEKVLRVDTRQEWVKAAADLQGLQLESLEKSHLLDLRARFQGLATKLRHKYTDQEMKNQFLQVCLRRPGTPESFINFMLDDMADVGTWEELWERLQKEEKLANLHRDLRRQGLPARKAPPAYPPRLNLMQARNQVESEAIDSDSEYDDPAWDGLGDEVTDSGGTPALFHIATGVPAGQTGPGAENTIRDIRSACHTCSGPGHHAAVCPHWDKDTDRVWMPRARARFLHRNARSYVTLQGRVRATGQTGPEKL